MNSINDLWNEILRILSDKLTPTSISTWFDDCHPYEIGDNKIIIVAKNEFTKGILSNRFSDAIKSACYDLFSCDFDVIIITEEEASNMEEEPPIDINVPPIMTGYTFDRFIVGNSNLFAYSSAKAVAEHPGGQDYNPLFIYGNSGLGKTHLLYSIANEIAERYPTKKIAYIKGEEFTNKLILAIQNRKMNEFRDEFRNVELFLVDDIQFIAGKESTQEEFFHTFNSIYEAGNQIVVTSDRPPIEMSLLEDRLRTRFEGGIMADIQPPDYETRTVIIRSKAAQLALVLSDESVQYIANNITANIRQLEGVIKKLTAYKDILNEVITVDSVKRAIEDVVKTGTDIPTPEKIIKETARYYNLTEDDVIGQNRKQNVAESRQIAMYLMRSLTNMSLVDIGKAFDGRNHATVLSSIRKIEDLMKNDASMSLKIRDISSNINSI